MTKYKIAILASIFIYPVLAFVFTIPYMIYQYRKYGSINKLRTVIIYSFIFYLLSCFFLIILPLPNRNSIARTSRFTRLNLRPFETVRRFFTDSGFSLHDRSTWRAALRTEAFEVPFFNIIMFIPLGIYLRYYFEQDFFDTVLIALLLSAFFELTQFTGLYFIYPTSYRICDVDDLIQNTSGGIIGYMICPLFAAILPTREEMDAKSYRIGQRVSTMRRAVAMAIDMGICFTITTFIRHHFQLDLPIGTIISIIYFVVLTVTFSGQTIGSRILNFCAVNKPSKLAGRGALLAIEFSLLPSLAIYVIRAIMDSPSLSAAMGSSALMFIIMAYLVVLLLKLLLNKPLLYDRILHTKYRNIHAKFIDI